MWRESQRVYLERKSDGLCERVQQGGWTPRERREQVDLLRTSSEKWIETVVKEVFWKSLGIGLFYGEDSDELKEGSVLHRMNKPKVRKNVLSLREQKTLKRNN